jgi:hypothetical protein
VATTRDQILDVMTHGKATATAKDISLLLYHKSPGCIADALLRMAKRGMVSGKTVTRDGHLCKEWTLTASQGTNRAAKGQSGTPGGSKGSPARSATMCTTQKVSLIAATEKVVNEFVAAGKLFSAHDITQEIRSRLVAGTIDVDKAECGVVHVGGGQEVAKVEHGDVRNIVHDLFGSGRIQGYDKTYTTDHFVFAPAPAAPAVAPDPASSSSSSGNYDGSSTL